MPLIDEFKGIKVYVYGREHRPPHVHMVYNEHEVLLIIETGEIYAGSLPIRKMKYALEWLLSNSDKVLIIFYELNVDLV